MKSYFETNAHNEILTRINQLKANDIQLWGKMNAGQMLHHCQMPVHIILEKKDYGLKPNWIINTLFKKSMYSDKLWRKNMPTVPSFKVSDEKDFETEKTKILNLLYELNANRERTDWQAHPAFGNLTKQQWGKMQYKHLDHHLRQFGV